MKRRAALALGLILAAWPWTSAAQAQDNVITNAEQLSALFTQPGVALSLAEPAMFWPSLDTLWVDFEQITSAIGAVQDYPGSTDLGVTIYPLRLTRTAAGTDFMYPWYGTALLQLPAPPDDDFSTRYADALAAFCAALGKPACLDDPVVQGYCLDQPEPRLVLDIWVASVADYGLYQSNVLALAAEDAESAGSGATEVASGGLMVMAEDDDGGGDGGDPCSITNLLQGFVITSIQQTTNQATVLTWPSCTMFRYIVLSADELSTNTAWQAQAYTSYVWGNAGATSWTDTTTVASANVTHRFYRVERMNASPIAAGGEHSLALTPDGRLWAWGSNGDGQLSDGTEFSRPWPVEVADPTVCAGQTITNAAALAAGGDEFIVVADATGTVWTCGDDVYGELGRGPLPDTDGSDSFPPSPITGVSNVVSVAAGESHTLALRSDGAVFAWGLDTFGRAPVGGVLGAGGLPSSSTNSPIQSRVPAGTVIVAIACGYSHSVALDASGNVWGWGDNGAGQIGAGAATGTDAGTNRPIQVPGISNVIAIAAGLDHTIALTADKRVWTWGGNDRGQLGDGTTTPRTNPAPVFSNVVAIAGGYYFTLAVTSNGQVYAWGDNGSGELATNGISSSLAPIRVDSLSNAVLVSANPGGYHSLAMTVDQGTNRYWGWGDNRDGEVGNGTNSVNSGGNDNQYTPAQAQFCSRCQRCVQLGTNGTFTAQCNGTLYLYFNTDNFGNAGGSYTASVDGFGQFTVMGNNGAGVQVGPVTNGQVCTFSANGQCYWNFNDTNTVADANGNSGTGTWDCNDFNHINKTNAVCPMWQCFSLVGRIQ